MVARWAATAVGGEAPEAAMAAVLAQAAVVRIPRHCMAGSALGARRPCGCSTRTAWTAACRSAGGTGRRTRRHQCSPLGLRMRGSTRLDRLSAARPAPDRRRAPCLREVHRNQKRTPRVGASLPWRRSRSWRGPSRQVRRISATRAFCASRRRSSCRDRRPRLRRQIRRPPSPRWTSAYSTTCLRLQGASCSRCLATSSRRSPRREGSPDRTPRRLWSRPGSTCASPRQHRTNGSGH